MKSVSRRKFFHVCSSYVAGLASLGTSKTMASAPTRFYNRVQLMRDTRPMRMADFEEGQSYIFHYPYVTTPCLIFNLGEAVQASHPLTTKSGTQYLWNGGTGPRNSIVAYSAICTHRMTYPAKSASFLNYRHSNVVYFDSSHTRQEREKVIYCCSERSVYDPKLGAKVISGPATQPLAAIELDYSAADDTIYAVGTRGGEMFDQFLSEFEFRLQLDFKITNISQLTASQVELKTIGEYSAVVVHC